MSAAGGKVRASLGLVVVLAVMTVPAAWAQDEEAPLPDIVCDLEPGREAIDVVCVTDALEPRSSLRMLVAVGADGDVTEDDALQGAGPVVDGAARAVVPLPCATRGPVSVEASARAEDGTRLVHRQELEVADDCLGRWDLTAGQWTRLVLLAALPVLAVMAVMVARRRKRRRRRRRRRQG